MDQVVGLAQSGLASGHLPAVVAAGGDGTIGLLANRLPSTCPIAIFPLGTENLLAKYLGLKPDPHELVEMLRVGRSVSLDVGQANGRLFLVMASIGFDAEVVRRLHRNRRGFIRHSSYFRPIWGAIHHYGYPPLRIEVDGNELSGRPTWAFIFNVPRYAMNLQIVPQANAFDGLLDLRTFYRGKLLSGLWYLANVLLNRHASLKDSTYRQATRIRINSDVPVPLQLDGDPAGTTPVEIVVVPKRLRVFAPEAFVKNLPVGAALQSDALNSDC